MWVAMIGSPDFSVNHNFNLNLQSDWRSTALAPVDENSAIHRINHSPVDTYQEKQKRSPLNRDVIQ